MTNTLLTFSNLTLTGDTSLHVTAAQYLKSPLGKEGVVYNKHLLFFHLCSQTEPFFKN